MRHQAEARAQCQHQVTTVAAEGQGLRGTVQLQEPGGVCTARVQPCSKEWATGGSRARPSPLSSSWALVGGRGRGAQLAPPRLPSRPPTRPPGPSPPQQAVLRGPYADGAVQAGGGVELERGTAAQAWGPGPRVRDQSHWVAWASPLPCPLTGDVVHGVVLGPVIAAPAVAQAELHQTIGGAVWVLKGHGDTPPKRTEHLRGVAAGEGAQQAQALLSIREDAPHLDSQVPAYGGGARAGPPGRRGVVRRAVGMGGTDLRTRCCSRWTQWR